MSSPSYSFQCSSASRKFLNGIQEQQSAGRNHVSVLFSEPKIPQFCDSRICRSCLLCFSALQRAENSSMRSTTASARATESVSVLFSEPKIPQSVDCTALHAVCTEFQCSSASRKFLNVAVTTPASSLFIGFSALQRAENSSIS